MRDSLTRCKKVKGTCPDQETCCKSSKWGVCFFSQRLICNNRCDDPGLMTKLNYPTCAMANMLRFIYYNNKLYFLSLLGEREVKSNYKNNKQNDDRRQRKNGELQDVPVQRNTKIKDNTGDRQRRVKYRVRKRKEDRKVEDDEPLEEMKGKCLRPELHQVK